jgi:hypothetical protein
MFKLISNVTKSVGAELAFLTAVAESVHLTLAKEKLLEMCTSR